MKNPSLYQLLMQASGLVDQGTLVLAQFDYPFSGWRVEGLVNGRRKREYSATCHAALAKFIKETQR